MIDQWLPAAVITAINLAIMFGTMRYAERGYRWHHNAQQAICRVTAAANRAERAASMQPPSGFGKANAMDVMLDGTGVVIMDEASGLFGTAADPRDVIPTLVETSHPVALNLEIIGEMMSMEVTEVSPGVLACGDFEVHLSEDGHPKTIRRRDGS